MTKTDTAIAKATETAESGFSAVNETLKVNLEKTAKIFADAADFNKANIGAYVESVTTAGEGFRTITSEISMYSKRLIEESAAATNAIVASKSFNEAVEIQTSFAKIAFGAYVGQLKLLNGMFVGTMNDTLAPMKERLKALSEIAQSPPPA